MQSRTSYTLAASLLLTVAACARQEEPDYEYEDEPADVGGSSKGGSTAKAGSLNSISGSTSTGKGGSTTLPPAGSVGGKGGSKATGGAAGKAGSGGAAGTGGAGDDEPVNMPVEGLSVNFKAQEGSSADFLGGETTVVNDSAETFSLTTLKVRYYFTNELNSPPTFVWQWGQFGPASNLGGITCTGEVVEMPSAADGANFYVELTCPEGDLASGGVLRMSWKAGNQGAGKLTQDDDWSYIAAEGAADKIVVLDGNAIVWGIEP